MKLARICRDTKGASAVEFGLTAPFFFALMMGAIEVGLLLWAQIGLQHGAESAARCATVNATICGNVSAIQNYAVQQAFGLNPAPSTFTVTTPACGNQVNATYSFQFFTSFLGMSSLTLGARSCFPK
jgi:Flp pilus assembly protein TadG